MFFSEKKLRELANLNDNIKTQDIVDAINSIGFEVEEVVNLNKNQGLKFGHVLNTYKNPNSTKLNVCEIDFNDGKRIIQTAAQNVKNNDYVIAFVPGSIFNGTKMESKEMGKIVSEGMLASFNELGFSSSLLTKELNDGVFTFNEIDLNLDPIEYLELNDNVIEVSILSNRSDAQSYQIFSRELAAYFQTKVNNDLYKEINNTFKSDIKLNNSNDCLLNGVEVENKDFKLSIKEIILLLKSNMKLSNNEIENFTNLVLINTGVSLRCFDKEKINTNISIQEKDGLFYLNDSKNNISILGINEVEEYKANINSKKILFEFSQIDKKIVRDNSKKSKFITNSSINNSREISNGLIWLTKNFISKYFDNVSELINNVDLNNIKIKFNEQYINKYAGFEITKDSKYDRAIKSLNILNFEFGNEVTIPNTRHDIKNMQNIVEEVFRFYGLNNFNPEQNNTKTLIIDSINSIEKTISALGYKQVWTYTLINDKKNKFNPFEFKDIKKLKTFVSEEYNSIRNSIALQMLNVFDYNIKRKIEKLSFFDLGMINQKKSIMIASNIKTYNEIKNDIEKITNQKFEIKKLDNEFLHPNYNAGLYLAGIQVGWIGKLNPFKYDYDIIFAEIFEDIIYKPNNKFVEFNSDPLKERDITFSIENDYENTIYLNKLNSIEGVFSIELISSFEKDNITKLTYKILMNEKALEEFEKINWENKEEIFDF